MGLGDGGRHVTGRGNVAGGGGAGVPHLRRRVQAVAGGDARVAVAKADVVLDLAAVQPPGVGGDADLRNVVGAVDHGPLGPGHRREVPLVLVAVEVPGVREQDVDLGEGGAVRALTIRPLPPRVTCRGVVVSLRGPGQSPVLPFACCVGSLQSVGRCGRCSCWCRCRVRGAQWSVCWGCAGCGGMGRLRVRGAR